MNFSFHSLKRVRVPLTKFFSDCFSMVASYFEETSSTSGSCPGTCLSQRHSAKRMGRATDRSASAGSSSTCSSASRVASAVSWCQETGSHAVPTAVTSPEDVALWHFPCSVTQSADFQRFAKYRTVVQMFKCIL